MRRKPQRFRQAQARIREHGYMTVIDGMPRYHVRPDGTRVDAPGFQLAVLARDLRIARRLTGLTRAQLGAKLGQPVSVVRDVETGRVKPPAAYKRALLRLAGCTPRWTAGPDIDWSAVATTKIPPRRWRQALAVIHRSLKVAENLKGHERGDQLVRACREMVAHNAPGWRMVKGDGRRADTPDVRAYLRAEAKLERQLGSAVDGIGHTMFQWLPEDPNPGPGTRAGGSMSARRLGSAPERRWALERGARTRSAHRSHPPARPGAPRRPSRVLRR